MPTNEKTLLEYLVNGWIDFLGGSTQAQGMFQARGVFVKIIEN